MGKIIVSVNVSLDGVVQDPTGEEATSAGGWFSQVADTDREAFGAYAYQEAQQATALLFGRRSYQWLAARWPDRTGPWADRLNAIPKYVVSSTLTKPDWNNSTVLRGNLQHGVQQLKNDIDGQIVVNASATLVRTLIQYDLIDEFRLLLYPFVLGSGERLFGPLHDRKALQLTEARHLSQDLALLCYRMQAQRP